MNGPLVGRKKSIKSDGYLEWDILHSKAEDLLSGGPFFCFMFVFSGVLETRASRGVRVFTCPKVAKCDAGQKYPPDSKTNIQQVAKSFWGFKWMVVGGVGCFSHITLSAKAFILFWPLNSSRENRSENQVKARQFFFFCHGGWGWRWGRYSCKI